jgi:hypothetical protein
MAHDPFTPNSFQSKALALWFQRVPVVAAMAGWGAGKSHLVAQVMQAQAETQPGVDGFYVTDSYGRGEGSIGDILERVLIPLGWRYSGGASRFWLSPAYSGKRTKVYVRSWKRPTGKDRSANSIESLNCGWGILDEANALDNDEVAIAMQGRVRAGPTPQILLLGKPSGTPWWLRFAEKVVGGVAFKCSSYANRDVLIANDVDFDAWVRQLPHRSYLENVLCQPQQPEGAVYSEWLAAEWPEGNLAPRGWRVRPDMVTRVAMDFGVRNPAALLIAHDPELDADVVWAEAAPDGSTTADVCRMLLRHVWPRRFNPPAGLVPLTRGVGDKAGANRRTDSGSDFKDVARRPEDGGLGIVLQRVTQSERVDIVNGVDTVKRRILDPHDGERRLLCCPRLWAEGLEREGRTFAKSITGYSWQAGSGRIVPRKDDVTDHHMDALRYDAVMWHWAVSTPSLAAFKRQNDAPLERWQEVATRER